MTMSELKVDVGTDGEVTVMELRGEIDSAAEEALGTGYARASEGTGPVVLDFSAVEYINSSGIALIVGLLAQARSHGTEIRARGLSDHYREIFEITRLSDFMTIENEAGDGASTSRRDGAHG
jgi:anti-anti-sigma factor